MISFKLFAGTNIGLRENNEDNFTVCPDLTQNEWIVPADQQQEHPLGKRGCVMVVADGMGGQNAGEVASAIAIDTVQELFSPDKMPADVLEKSDGIKSFLKNVISVADERIKSHAKEFPDTFGMGSTIVITWLLGNKLYVAWLGDSRAYSFLPNKGIGRLSKDHSYVQQLVDSGALTDEEAMNHPNSNVITRSLGDSSQKAKADVAEYDVVDGEIILLCSDGLCGVCPDAQIGGIIEAEQADLVKCKERLTTAALAAGGSDNITISLLQIKSDKKENDIVKPEKQDDLSKYSFSLRDIVASVFGLFLLIAIIFAFFSICKSCQKSNPESSIKLSLSSNTLKNHEWLNYEVEILGKDSTYTFEYDKRILEIDMKEKKISLLNSVLVKDTTLQIVVVCDADATIRDTAFLNIKYEPIIEIKDAQNLGSIQKAENIREQAEEDDFENEADSSGIPTKTQQIANISPTPI